MSSKTMSRAFFAAYLGFCGFLVVFIVWVAST